MSRWPRQVSLLTAIAVAVMFLGYATVELNQRLDRIHASSMPFYLSWIAIGALWAWRWPAIARTPWRARIPASRADWLALGGVTAGVVFLYQNAVVALLQGRAHAPPSVLTLVAGGLVGPFVEEWLFRGLVQEAALATAPSLGTVGAIAYASALFGVWHLPFEGLTLESARMAVVHAVFGAMMALLRTRFGGLLPGSVLHAAGNALTILTA